MISVPAPWLLAPVMAYIPIGPSIDNGESIKFWTEYIYSQASSDTGGTAKVYDPESAGQTSLERENLPDTGPVISIYDPEIQALLAFE